MNGVTNPAALVRWPTLVVFREVTRWHRCDRVARTGSLAHRLEVLPVRVRGDGRSLAAPLFDLFADLHRPIMRPFALVCGFAPCGACCGAPSENRRPPGDRLPREPIVALVQMFDDDFNPDTMSPERRQLLEGAFLERREHARRGAMPREYREPPGPGVAAPSIPAYPPKGKVQQPTPAHPPTPTSTPTIERAESLRDMARRIGAKARRA